MIIRFNRHAMKRLIWRSCLIGMDPEEAFIRINETITEGRISRTKHSKRNKIYYRYYHDNFSFFVFVHKQKKFWIIKTIIIERGRK